MDDVRAFSDDGDCAVGAVSGDVDAHDDVFFFVGVHGWFGYGVFDGLERNERVSVLVGEVSEYSDVVFGRFFAVVSTHGFHPLRREEPLDGVFGVGYLHVGCVECGYVDLVPFVSASVEGVEEVAAGFGGVSDHEHFGVVGRH